MGLKLGRAVDDARVQIDAERCTGCGLCSRVCAGMVLRREGDSIQVDQSRLFGCIACGHCMAVCPPGCITISGRDLTPEDMLPLAAPAERADFASLLALLRSRRSVRRFQEREVERETIDQILDAATSAPMGIPPSEVKALVFASRTQVKAFKDELITALMKWRSMLSPIMLALQRPLLGKEGTRLMRDFVAPVVREYLKCDRQGEDIFFYNAPLAMLFYGSPYADAMDPVIAATYAMLAAEALGLGSCMLGFPGYIVKNDKAVRQKYDIPPNPQPGIALVFGYPAITFQRAIRRRFAGVQLYD